MVSEPALSRSWSHLGFIHFLILCNLFILGAVTSTVDSAMAATLQQRITHRRGYLVPLNSQIILSCPFETPFYKWTRPDYPSHFLDETKNLTINVDSFDVSGRYQCSAVNGFGNSLAEMAVRVVDYNSPAIRRDCALSRDGGINKAGPCFLKSYTDSDLVITRYWGEDVILDCNCVMANGRTYQLNYAWEFNKQDPNVGSPSASVENRLTRRSNARNSVGSSVPVGVPQTHIPGSVGSGGRADVTHFSEPQLTLRKVTLANAGKYRCSVTNPSPDSSVSFVPKIERTFQLYVIPRSEGAIIIGDHDLTVHVKSGENLIQSCKVNDGQHRSVTIRWGKVIDPNKVASDYEGTGKEIIHLSNIAFIVFPLMPTIEASNKLTSSSSSISAPFAVSDPGSLESQLVILRVTSRDSGMYICSVITESGWDDRKIVQVVVSDSQIDSSADAWDGSYQQRLALYIAAPVIIFFVGIFIISFCMMNRKGRRSSQLNGHTRAILPAIRQMGNNNNNSAGAYRSGQNGNNLSGKTNNIGLLDHHRIHPSPQGPASTVTVTSPNQIVYSSSTGSHSLSGTSAGTPGSMLLANTMVQVLPPDGSGYPLSNPNGHLHQPPLSPHNSGSNNNFDPYTGVPSSNGAGSGIMYRPTGYSDFQS